MSAGHQRSPTQVSRLASPIASPKKATCLITGSLTFGTFESVSGVPLSP